MSVAPAITNALARGLGVRIKDLPLTPERVWRALKEKEKYFDDTDIICYKSVLLLEAITDASEFPTQELPAECC